MKLLFNQFIIKFLPFIPLFIVRLIARRYVAGETVEDSLKIVKKLIDRGFSATVDVLGEHTKDEKTAKIITNYYEDLLHNIHEQNLDCNLSIKPSHIGMDISIDCLDENITQLIKSAKNYNNFIRFDMENSDLTDSTINLYKKCKDQYDQVGIVFQAYLYRTENDLEICKDIVDFNFRLCKGIYRESPNIAIKNRQDINNNFIQLLRFAFHNNLYVGIATHDIFLIKETYKLINELKIPNNRFEFQVLYGVPMSGWLEKHLEHNYKVRVYVPFGKDWYDYSIRRLKENPNIAGYILRDLFRR